jgi:hypothetical protein
MWKSDDTTRSRCSSHETEFIVNGLTSVQAKHFGARSTHIIACYCSLISRRVLRRAKITNWARSKGGRFFDG